ncbi:MAG: hypothetical protein WCL54_00315 [Clostridia bacterium]
MRKITSLLLLCVILFSSCTNQNQKVIVNDNFQVYVYKQKGAIDAVLIVDAQGNLFERSVKYTGVEPKNSQQIEYAKVMGQVKQVSGKYALKNDGTLWSLEKIKEPKQLYSNVRSFEQRTNVLNVLKNDGTLWAGLDKPVLIAEQVKSSHDGMFLQNDGSLWAFWRSGQTFCMTDNVKEYFFYEYPNMIFIIKNDNVLYSYRVADNIHSDGISLEYSFEKNIGQYLSSQKKKVKFEYYWAEVVNDIVQFIPSPGLIYVIRKDNSLWSFYTNWNSRPYYNNDYYNKVINRFDNVKQVYFDSAGAYALKFDGTLWNVKNGKMIIGNVKDVFISELNFNGTTKISDLALKNDSTLFDFRNENLKVLDNVLDVKCSMQVASILQRDGSLWFADTESFKYKIKVADNVRVVLSNDVNIIFIKNDGKIFEIEMDPYDIIDWSNFIVQVAKEVILN